MCVGVTDGAMRFPMERPSASVLANWLVSVAMTATNAAYLPTVCVRGCVGACMRTQRPASADLWRDETVQWRRSNASTHNGAPAITEEALGRHAPARRKRCQTHTKPCFYDAVTVGRTIGRRSSGCGWDRSRPKRRELRVGRAARVRAGLHQLHRGGRINGEQTRSLLTVVSSNI